MANHMAEANELLRSAHAIAGRKGEDTNWDAFKTSLEELLLKQSEILNKTNNLTAATCTARVYRKIKE